MSPWQIPFLCFIFSKRGDAFYNSKFVPKSSLIKEQDLDPLGYLLPMAKEKGLKVHVWVYTYLLWSSGVKPIQSEHIINTKIEWLDHNQIQQRSIKETLSDNKNKKNGFEGAYLSPGHPDVNKYLLKVFKELVINYDIDGLHLDYIRLHDQGYGCLLYTSPSPRDATLSRMPSSA